MYEISAAFVKQFNANLTILSQQKGSRLRNCVLLKTGVVGEDTYMDQIGKTEAVDLTTRHQDTPIVNTEYQRRKISMIPSAWNDLIDWQDLEKMLTDPKSQYALNAAYALGRKMDARIIAKAFDTAYVGKEGSSTESFPSANVVAVGASGMTLAKLLAAKEILDNNDVDPEEERYVTVCSKQIQDMLKIDEFISADYNTVKALVAGARTPFTFLGFTFVPISSSLLATDSNSYRRVICWAKNGLGLALSSDIMTRADERKDKNYAVQVYAKMSSGATRLDEDKVVEIKCSES
jgi:hypothetical protein